MEPFRIFVGIRTKPVYPQFTRPAHVPRLGMRIWACFKLLNPEYVQDKLSWLL